MQMKPLMGYTVIIHGFRFDIYTIEELRTLLSCSQIQVNESRI